MIKKNLLTVSVAFIASVMFAQMPRSEWHSKVGECVLDPVMLKATISKLSSSDKTAFLAEVNEAISKMPGSQEVKAAQFLAANRAAVAGAGSADRAAVLSEMFATVPPEALAVVNEEFAKSEFSRSASMNDLQFIGIVTVAMAKIAQRCSSAESGAVRAAFAGFMFVRAAGTAAEGAQVAAIAALPAEAQNEARNTWFPAALGKDQVASYDPMLAAAQAGEEPDHAATIAIFSNQIVESMLADLQSGALPGGKADGSKFGSPAVNFFNGDTDAMNVMNPMPSRAQANNLALPRSLIEVGGDKFTPAPNPYYSGGRDAGDREPGPYWLQRL
jgi:hypothetical protein